MRKISSKNTTDNVQDQSEQSVNDWVREIHSSDDIEADQPIIDTERIADERLQTLAPHLYGADGNNNTEGMGLKLTPEFTIADVRESCAQRLNKLPKKQQKAIREGETTRHRRPYTHVSKGAPERLRRRLR